MLRLTHVYTPTPTHTNTQTEETDRQACRQAGRQTDRQTEKDKQADRHRDRDTEIRKEGETERAENIYLHSCKHTMHIHAYTNINIQAYSYIEHKPELLLLLTQMPVYR